jgi:hypothetical protein
MVFYYRQTKYGGVRMHGFTNEGILIYPKYETWDSRGYQFQSYLRSAVKAVVEYFNFYNIKISCLTTDEVAVQERPVNVGWVDVIPAEDKFFVKNNCGMGNIPEADTVLYDIYDKARKKYPAEKGMPVADRFSNVVIPRERFIFKEFIKTQKLVISFELPTNRNYPVAVEKGDGRLVLEIGNTNFLAKAVFSGEPIDPLFILQDPSTTKAVYRWEGGK